MSRDGTSERATNPTAARTPRARARARERGSGSKERRRSAAPALFPARPRTAAGGGGGGESVVVREGGPPRGKRSIPSHERRYDCAEDGVKRRSALCRPGFSQAGPRRIQERRNSSGTGGAPSSTVRTIAGSCWHRMHRMCRGILMFFEGTIGGARAVSQTNGRAPFYDHKLSLQLSNAISQTTRRRDGARSELHNRTRRCAKERLTTRWETIVKTAPTSGTCVPGHVLCRRQRFQTLRGASSNERTEATATQRRSSFKQATFGKGRGAGWRGRRRASGRHRERLVCRKATHRRATGAPRLAPSSSRHRKGLHAPCNRHARSEPRERRVARHDARKSSLWSLWPRAVA